MVKYKHLVMMGLAGGALATLSIGCGKVTPEAPNITADMSVVAEGSTFSDGTLDPLGAKLKISLSGLDGFTLQEPPAGCKDTVSATEEHGYGGWFQPAWSPYDCPNPEIDENIDQADWDSKGHLQVFVNGIYVGDGYSSDFSLEFLSKGLYYYRSIDWWGGGLDGISRGANIDGDGVIEPWADPFNILRASSYGLNFDFSHHAEGTEVDPNAYCSLLLPLLENDNPDGGLLYLSDFFGAVDSTICDKFADYASFDYGKDYDGDGEVVDNEETSFLSGTTIAEHDYDGDGFFDTKEDMDGDKLLDVNEDSNGDGLPGMFVGKVGDVSYYLASEDVDCDGKLDVNEDLNGNGLLDCGEDLDADGRLDGIDTDGDKVPDSDEDLNGDGFLTQGPDTDLDKDCRIDGFKVYRSRYQYATNVFVDYDGNAISSEDKDSDGILDLVTEKDLDADNVFDELDKDGDGFVDVKEETGIEFEGDCENIFGCEGDDVYLVRSADLLLDQTSLWVYGQFRLNGQYEADYCPDNTEEPVTSSYSKAYNVVTVKFVHDDHSPVYGAPVFKYELTTEDLVKMNLLPSALVGSDGSSPAPMK